jgi:hypothetical protein
MYLAVLPLDGIAHAEADRVGVAAAQAAFGPLGTGLIAVLIMVSTFGCVNGLIMAGARVYYSMAGDGLFFRRAGTLNAQAVPGWALWLQALWAGVLCLSGRYGDLLDYVIFATGQRPEDTADMGLELARGGHLVVDGSLSTSVEGVFAAGDVVTGTKTVIAAIARGRDAASSIDRFLGGDGDISEVLVDPEEPEQELGRAPESFYSGATLPQLSAADERKLTFEAFECPFTEGEATCEASRCLQCDLRLTITRPRLWNEY